MERKVAAVATLAALASGGFAVAVSYRLWGADTAALKAQVTDMEESIVDTKERLVKIDGIVIGLIDTFKAVEAKLTNGAAGFWCATEKPTTGFVSFGLCKRTEAGCEQWRSTASSLSPSSCAKQEHAYCTASTEKDGTGAREDCFPNKDLCHVFATEVTKESKRIYLGCETK